MEVDIHPYKVQLNIDGIVLVLQAISLVATWLKMTALNCMQRLLLMLRWWRDLWGSCQYSDGSATPEWCESLFLYIKPSTIQNGDKGNKSLIIIICDTDSHTASRLCSWSEWTDNGGGLPLSGQQERLAWQWAWCRPTVGLGGERCPESCFAFPLQGDVGRWTKKVVDP